MMGEPQDSGESWTPWDEWRGGAGATGADYRIFGPVLSSARKRGLVSVEHGDHGCQGGQDE